MKEYKHIIWDWNGTLLDDVDIVIDAMNRLLSRRGLPNLDRETYKRIFTFPVKEYYAQIGFDFNRESFEQLAAEYIKEFTSGEYRFKLHEDAENVLGYIRGKGIGQSVLSASREEELLVIVKKLGIKQYFKSLAGLHNHYATSKVERGKALINELCLDPKEVIIIGDTIHDYEVTCEIGCDCLLVANGHQSHERLEVLATDIVRSLKDVVGRIKTPTCYNTYPPEGFFSTKKQ